MEAIKAKNVSLEEKLLFLKKWNKVYGYELLYQSMHDFMKMEYFDVIGVKYKDLDIKFVYPNFSFKYFKLGCSYNLPKIELIVDSNNPHYLELIDKYYNESMRNLIYQGIEMAKKEEQERLYERAKFLALEKLGVDFNESN